MLRVGHLEGEARDGDPVPGRGDRRRQDGDVGVGQHPRHVGEQPGAVQRLALDGHQEHRAGGRRPLHRYDPLLLRQQRGGVDAVAAVHADPVAAGDEADDLVAGHGGAAARELDPHIRDALDDDAGIAGRSRPAHRPGRDGGLGQVLDRTLGPAEPGHDPLHDVLGGHPALADLGVERCDVGQVQLLGQVGQSLPREQPLQRQPLLANRPGDRVLALLDGVLATLLGVPGLDLVARPRARDELQPVLARVRGLGLAGEDLDHVAVVER